MSSWTGRPEDPASRMSAEAVSTGDATRWFDELYKAAAGDASVIPWADLAPNPWLVEWLDREHLVTEGSTAVVVGCGLGDDAEELARRGYDVVAFDISETAIEWAKQRSPDTPVEYRNADLFSLPKPMEGAFDFVFDAYTIQSLPETLRSQAIASVASLVAPGGTVLVVARGREAGEDLGGPPWPLSHDELRGFEHAGLLEDRFEDFTDDKRAQPVRRFRASYVRPA